ncbi:MAG: hypothetical protein AAF799_15000 [Myxococcota bacterium]
MIQSPRLFALCALFVTMPACDSAEDDPINQVNTLVDSNVAELDSQVAIVCDCWQDIGFESRTDCQDEVLELGPAQVRCIKDAYAEDAETAIDYLECIVPLEREYTACIDQRLECSDFSAGDACSDDYGVGLDTCIQLPRTITRDLDACFD